MAIFFDVRHLPQFEHVVLTSGTFDGVHQGHRAIINEVVRHARQVNGVSVLLTFEPHPRKLLFPDKPLGIITPLAQKLKLLTEAGIQHIVVAPFTRAFSALSAHEYLDQFLIQIFNPGSIVIGYDHRFGHGREGDFKLLEEYANVYHYDLIEIPEQLIDEAAVSSTKIRRAILEGKMDDATMMLGRPYALYGSVVHGAKLGRTLGFPTANLEPLDSDQIVPGNGIYAATVHWNGVTYKSMLSIGYNPTVSDTPELKIEVNIFGFDADIYGETVEISFIRKFRDEQKFDSIETLTQQLHADRATALAILENEA